MPHSVFLGRVVRPGRDPLWTDTDRGYALAWTVNKRSICGGCGTRADEWDDDENAYISDHYQCQGCARLAEESQNNLDMTGDKPAPGQHTFLRPPKPGEIAEDD